ncbi:hypothetical protein PGTUg99_025669 [Puccinia graminis f. sp. tritici]|uniref:Uncharacterized protein n=1 Tax=Puccinia graminis f. sp. tritici TaxID=56615 RepID=A0A5B0RMJ5_PUCGR|nr:hypothetical protein PGTUg99_025669 [Puccinia graminis f. sp. tritici]
MVNTFTLLALLRSLALLLPGRFRPSVLQKEHLINVFDAIAFVSMPPKATRSFKPELNGNFVCPIDFWNAQVWLNGLAGRAINLSA